jgi:hypothetical protein
MNGGIELNPQTFLNQSDFTINQGGADLYVTLINGEIKTTATNVTLHQSLGSWVGAGRGDIIITNPPASGTAQQGVSASFTVSASGDDPKTYQWQFNAAIIPNATSPIFNIDSAQPTNAGSYTVVISNIWGAVTSAPATLGVLGIQPFISTAPGDISYQNGQFTLRIAGLTGQGDVAIATSPDLLTWTYIYTNPPAFGSIRLTNSTGGATCRFYRAKILPN